MKRRRTTILGTSRPPRWTIPLPNVQTVHQPQPIQHVAFSTNQRYHQYVPESTHRHTHVPCVIDKPTHQFVPIQQHINHKTFEPLQDPIFREKSEVTQDQGATWRENARHSAIPPKNASGYNHFVKFRTSREQDARMGYDEDIVQVMIEFWEYLKINSDVNTASTLSAYMTNVKMWQLYKHETIGTPNIRFPKWPAPSKNAELAKRLRNAATFFHEFGAKKGEKRIPLTDGLLKLIQPLIPGSIKMRKEIFDCLLMTKLTGNRMGEITAENKTTSKFMTVGDVRCFHTQVDFKCLSKALIPKPELTFATAAEVSPLVTRYGSTWNFCTSTKKRIAGRKDTEPLYTDDQNRPLTYQDVYKALRIACGLLDIDRGIVGCHSGRIYMATLMAYKGCTVAQIMKRGRWKSDAWMVYVTALIRHARNSSDPHAFRIGDLAIPLDNYPNLHEFSRF